MHFVKLSLLQSLTRAFVLSFFIASFSSAQTANELLNAGSQEFDQQNFLKAEETLSRFIKDYGTAKEAEPFLEPALRVLGICQIKLGKFSDAIETIERYQKSFPQGEKVEEFSFWLGIAHLKSDDPVKAQAQLERFIKQYPQSKQKADAQFNLGLCFMQQDKLKEATAYFSPLIAQLPPALAYQAKIICLYSYLEQDQLEEAFTLFNTINPQAKEATKLVAYHLLALDLGNKLLEQDSYRKALSALQRVWSRTRLQTRQQGQLETLKKEFVSLSTVKSGDQSFELIRTQDLIQDIEKELKQLEKITDYDTALQLRIGRCFYELDRPREAYLAMKEMVAKLPDSDLLASANYMLLLCLTSMERWEEAIAATWDFEKRFSKSKEMGNVIYLRAESYQRANNYSEAYVNFKALAEQFPDHAQSQRALFLAGYALLMQEKNLEAYAQFEANLKLHPQGSFAEQSLYWQAMSLHFNKEYAKSRDAFFAYLKKYPEGTQAAEVTFRAAQSLFNQKFFIEAYKELEEFVKKYPQSAPVDEAYNLLGDTYLALGEIDRGLAAYKKVTPANSKLYEYGLFRTGLAYKALEKYDVMQSHFNQFIKERPNSPRLTEALAQIAWVHRRLEQPDKAKEVYWAAIKKYGNDPEAVAVEDMMKTLARMYRTPEEKTQLLTLFQQLEKQSLTEKKLTLTARALWMQAVLTEKTNPAEADRLRLSIVNLTPLRDLSPQILADVADELRSSKRYAESQEYYQTILSWYPLSMLKDRAYAGLGLVAWEENKPALAQLFFYQFEKESISSPLWTDILNARAAIFLSEGKKEEAVQELEKILEVKSAKGKPWAEALYRLGEIRLSQKDPKRALPYFQRIYVMYGRWTELVAKSYWQSGQAFEQLNMRQEALNTYKEFLGQEHLRQTPEFTLAEERLKTVGGA